MKQKWIKIKEACEFLCIKPSTIHAKIRNDKDFPMPSKIGGILLFNMVELEQYVDKKRMVEKPIKKDLQKQFIKNISKLAPNQEAIKDQQTKDNHTKELINDFVTNSFDYFEAMHTQRHVFPFIKYGVLDERVQSLLELYESKLAYLMRNPDCKFQTADDINANNEDNIKIKIIFGINKALCLEDESTKSVNNFIEKLLIAWNRFKQQNKGK